MSRKTINTNTPNVSLNASDAAVVNTPSNDTSIITDEMRLKFLQAKIAAKKLVQNPEVREIAHHAGVGAAIGGGVAVGVAAVNKVLSWF